MLNFTVTQPPAAEPVSLLMAKNHLRVDFVDDDALISTYIQAAREWAENYTQRAFFTQTIVLSLDAFPLYEYGNGTVLPMQQRGYPYFSAYWDPLAIRLPRPAALAVSSITYLDVTNTQQTLDPTAYYVDITSEPARIVPKPSFTWPSTQVYLPGAVQITYTTGSYGDGVEVNNCPAAVKIAMLLIIGHLYEHREENTELALKTLPMGATNWLDTVRIDQMTFDSGN